MTAYDQLRAEALDALAKHLAKNKVPAGDSTRLLDGLRDSSFAGFIALLGTSKDQGGDVGQTLLHEAAGKIAASSDVKQLHLGADDIDAWWKRAVDAGCEVAVPLQLMFWGDQWGNMRDPFGVEWAMNAPAKKA